jgi:hypothetical protein
MAAMDPPSSLLNDMAWSRDMIEKEANTNDALAVFVNAQESSIDLLVSSLSTLQACPSPLFLASALDAVNHARVTKQSLLACADIVRRFAQDDSTRDLLLLIIACKWRMMKETDMPKDLTRLHFKARAHSFFHADAPTCVEIIDRILGEYRIQKQGEASEAAATGSRKCVIA